MAEQPSNESRMQARLNALLAGPGVGLAILYAAAIGAYFLFKDLQTRDLSQTSSQIFALGSLAVVLILLFVGVRIVNSSSATQKDVIPDKDRKLLEALISDSNEKAIDQYVRLSSLTGGTGLATKLGLTGLPLLTVALTLIFCSLELYKPGTGFMDLTKLTLGAFIGSFVQRVATSQSAGSAGRVPPVA
ncbi:hypothetical protein NKI54_29080 [Mesorhizobium sp. M0663]|uniref:hypothetical protein n=1 Tax=unclassified Mesorhizobium TaxID=325217 RepID=UPI003338750F